MRTVQVVAISGEGWTAEEVEIELTNSDLSLTEFAQAYWGEPGERVEVEERIDGSLFVKRTAMVEVFSTDPDDPSVEHSQVFDLQATVREIDGFYNKGETA